MTLGERIKNLRQLHGLSRGELSQRSGVSSRLISCYENQGVEPSFFNMCCLADALEISLDYFAGKRELTEKEREEIFNKRCAKLWQDMN